MSIYPGVAQALGNLSLLALILALVLSGFLVVPRGRSVLQGIAAASPRPFLLVAWIVAAIATAGSLFLSDIVGFTPCALCWYQRIAMYPLVLVLGVATLTADGSAWRYSVPLALVGLLIAGYHYALQLRPALPSGACSPDAPCSMRYLAVHGFVSIPFMAGAAFILIGLLVLAARSSDLPETDLLELPEAD